MKKCLTVMLLMIFVALLPPSNAPAYDLPSVNLGFTSFMDGGPPAGPGFYFTQYFQYISSDRFTDDGGDKIGFPNADVEVFVSLSQFIYQSDRSVLFGGKWGLDVIVPMVSTDIEYGASGPFPEDNGAGLGDILVGPFLQWGPVMGKNGPRFMHRIELQMIFPTGEYDDDSELNPGSNFFSFNPYWSGTLFITPRWTASTRIHYLWNGENDNPNRGFGSVSDTRAGQAVHMNFATAYEVVPGRLRLGLNGYYLKQITDTEADGHDIDDRREQVLGIGPGLLAHFGPDNHLFFNAYFETAAENRPEASRFNFRYVHHF